MGRRPSAAPAALASSSPPLVRVRSRRDLPILAAVANQYFVEENLDVDYAQFVSSRPTFIQVDQREIEFIVSATDNAINYQLNCRRATRPGGSWTTSSRRGARPPAWGWR
ncbi:hypothetical protein ACRAWF_40115 [Streptomyces sp. L7]